MTDMVYHAIQLDYKAQRIFLEKGDKRDIGLIRSYQVINFLNYMSKIVEKVVAQ